MASKNSTASTGDVTPVVPVNGVSENGGDALASVALSELISMLREERQAMREERDALRQQVIDARSELAHMATRQSTLVHLGETGKNVGNAMLDVNVNLLTNVNWRHTDGTFLTKNRANNNVIAQASANALLEIDALSVGQSTRRVSKRWQSDIIGVLKANGFYHDGYNPTLDATDWRRDASSKHGTPAALLRMAFYTTRGNSRGFTVKRLDVGDASSKDASKDASSK